MIIGGGSSGLCLALLQLTCTSHDGCVQAPTTTKPTPAPYEVPAEFDKSLLGEVDLSSKDAAELGLPHAFWLRWMHLREQVSFDVQFVI